MSVSSVEYRLWVNQDRTVLVRLWADGRLELATRGDEGDIWGPPMELEEVRRAAYRK